MIFTVIYFNRKSRTGPDFQDDLNAALALGALRHFNVHASPDATQIVVELLQDEKAKADSEAYIFGIDPTELVVSNMNTVVGELGNKQKYKAINLLPIGGNRALGVIVTDDAVEVKSSDGTAKRKEAQGKQNKKPDAGSDTGAKAPTVGGDGTPNSGGPA